MSEPEIEARLQPWRPGAIFAELSLLLGPGSRREWLVVVALAVVGAGVESIGALLIFYVSSWLVGAAPSGLLGGLLPAPGSDRLPLAMVGLIAGFFLFRGAFVLYSTWFQARAVHLTSARISDRLFRSYLAAPYKVYLRRNSPELMRNALSSVEGVATRFLTPVVSVVTQMIIVGVLVVVLAVIAPLATLLVAVVLSVTSMVVMRLVRSRLKHYGKLAEQATQTSLATIQQSFNEARSIRILGRERYFAEAFSADRRQFADSRLFLSLYSKVPRVAIESIIFLLLAGFLTSLTTVDTAESVGVVGLFGYAALRIMPGLNQLVSGLNLIRYGRASVENVLGDLEGEGVEGPDLEPPAARRERLPWSELVLDDVVFSYHEAAPPALAGASLTILRGKILGLVGQTGSGKSTIIDLILGLLEPSSGDVRIDGRDLSEVRTEWQANLGLVPQDIYLLDASITKNVAFGIPEAEIDRERVAECLRIAQLSEFIERSELGVDTRIGERGTSLSGGERQRIAIARALYSSPSLLILDEGTSAIDTITELKLVDELKRSEAIDTVIVVSHRLSSLRICDSIAVIDDGMIVSRGDYETLMEGSPLFHDLTRSSQ